MTTAPVSPLAVRPKKAAVMLGLSYAMTYRLIMSGELVSFKFGRARVIPITAIEDWLARNAAQRRSA